MSAWRVCEELLEGLYGEESGRATAERLRALLHSYAASTPAARTRGWTQRDALLITYADQLREPGVAPLRSLAGFCHEHLRGLVSGVHLLPFYPFSSDDGFSVSDYRRVDPAMGTWEDVARLRRDFRLMFDAVLNHVSAQSAWFQGFLRDDPRYRDYFIVVPEGADLSQVVRPRTLPLLTRFATPNGEKLVWTTFSADQIDLNYHNPDVLLQAVDTLLFYVGQGAEFIRLDAIAYLWKEIGTPCIHLPQTHRVIQLFRAVLDVVAPDAALITETNVPHQENISYFGDGANEAQAVYNFALPPLVLHTFQTGSARALSRWAAGLQLPSRRVTFFNFLASHDGIGVNPARGILTPAEIDALAQRVQAHGGYVSYKSDPDGTQSTYELNINYFDALSDPHADESLELQVARFAAAHAIMLALVGMPGIYFHSLFGSRGWSEGVERLGHKRAVNREKLQRADVERELANPASRRARVFQALARLLQVRAAHPAFHPLGAQRVLDCGESVFALLRSSPESDERVLCLHNVSERPQHVGLDEVEVLSAANHAWTDVITRRLMRLESGQALALAPYEVLWLIAEG